MGAFLIGFFTVILVLLSLFMILIILMQRASLNSSMGATLGGGAAESAFGADTGNVLTRTTIYCVIIFFIMTLGLYLGYMYQSKHKSKLLPQIVQEKSGSLLEGMLITEGTSSSSDVDISKVQVDDSEGDTFIAGSLDEKLEPQVNALPESTSMKEKGSAIHTESSIQEK